MAKQPQKHLPKGAHKQSSQAKTPVIRQNAQISAETKKSLSAKKLMYIILAAVSFLLYINTVQNSYVLDDTMVITKNTIVTKGIKAIPELLTTAHLKGFAIFTNETYRPLSLVLFAIEYQLFGASAGAGHFFNILFYIGCVLLLFIFLDKFFEEEKTGVAFIASLLFAVHPIHTEVVANIKSRDELLCFFLAFSCLILFINYSRNGKIFQLLAGASCLFLAFLSKETVVTFLGIIPLVFFFYKNENRNRSIYIVISAVLVTLIFLAVRAAVLHAPYLANDSSSISFMDNSLTKPPTAASGLATKILILGYYIKLLFIPYPLICDYSYNSIPFTYFSNPGVILSLLLYIALAIFAITKVFKKNKDPWAFGILFYLMTLSLFSNIPFLIGAVMADRFLFFASVGFCLLLALAVDKWVIKSQTATAEAILKNVKTWFILAPVCLLFGSIAIARNSDWKNNSSLYKTDLEKMSDNGRLNYYVGDELQHLYTDETDANKQKQMNEESMDYFKKALQIYPIYPEALVDMGVAYFQDGKSDSAEKFYRKALALDPNQTNATNNLGTIYIRSNRFREALDLYKKAITINPNYVEAYFNLGICYIQVQQFDSAIAYFNKTLDMNPNYTKTYEVLAITYNIMGNKALTEKNVAIAKHYNPNFKLP